MCPTPTSRWRWGSPRRPEGAGAEWIGVADGLLVARRVAAARRGRLGDRADRARTGHDQPVHAPPVPHGLRAGHVAGEGPWSRVLRDRGRRIGAHRRGRDLPAGRGGEGHRARHLPARGRGQRDTRCCVGPLSRCRPRSRPDPDGGAGRQDAEHRGCDGRPGPALGDPGVGSRALRIDRPRRRRPPAPAARADLGPARAPWRRPAGIDPARRRVRVPQHRCCGAPRGGGSTTPGARPSARSSCGAMWRPPEPSSRPLRSRIWSSRIPTRHRSRSSPAGSACRRWRCPGSTRQRSATTSAGPTRSRPYSPDNGRSRAPGGAGSVRIESCVFVATRPRVGRGARHVAPWVPKIVSWVDANATKSLVQRASQLAAVAATPPRWHPAGPGARRRTLAGGSADAGLRVGGGAR